MVLLTITPAAKSAIELYKRLQKSEELDQPPACESTDEPSLAQPEVGAPISHGQLIDIVKALKTQHEKSQDISRGRIDLDTLLKGSQVYVPPPKPSPAPTSEYIALMARLREDEERRAYDRMVNPLAYPDTSRQRHPQPTAFGAAASAKSPIAVEEDDTTYQDINRQMTLIINVLVTIIASSVTIWMAARYWSTPQRLALSMTGSIVIAAAEVVIYMGYIKRVEDAKVDERKRREAKEVVETWVIDGKKEKERRSGGRGTAAEASEGGTRHRKGKHR